MRETSESIQKRVQAAREIQKNALLVHSLTSFATPICASGRYGNLWLANRGQSLMRAAMSQMNLSARAYHRILKLARTIADLAGSEEIQSAHLADALQYRPKLMIG